MSATMPESAFAASSGLAQIVWGTDADASPEPAQPPAPRSAAALAAATRQLLEALVEKRLPRLDKARQAVQQTGTGADPSELEHALAVMHAEAAALDFLAGRTGGARAVDFLRQVASLTAAADKLRTAGQRFAERQAIEGPVARLLWIELVLESDALRKRVRQGAHWLAQMEHDLRARRAAATAQIARSALEELGRHGRNLHRRLHAVHVLCGSARAIHAACERLAGLRAALCETLQDDVRPALQELQRALQPLRQAALYRPLVPVELMVAIDAHHALEVALAQAAAELSRLRAAELELAGRFAGLGQQAAALS